VVPPSFSTPRGSSGDCARRVRSRPCTSRRWRNPPARWACPDSVVGDAGVRGESGPAPRGFGRHTNQAEQLPLRVVYWNVAGVKASDIDTFLEHIDVDPRWDVLILLECSHARHEIFLSGIRRAGRLVSAQPWQPRRRAGALIFNGRLRIREVTLMFHGRAFGADFQWGGWKIRIVGGHAEPSGDRVPHQESVGDMDAIMEDTPLDHIIILGVDAQTCLGPRKAFACNDTMGEYVMAHRGWRGDCLLKLLEAYRLHLPQTFVEGFDIVYTCVGNRHNEPTQIDYMAISAPPHFITHAQIADTSATISDHWPLSFVLKPKTRACKPPWKAKSTEAKPIGWQLT
jgi:hypothetical protein